MKTLFSIINLSQAWRTKKQKSRAAGRFENQSSYSLRRQKNWRNLSLMSNSSNLCGLLRKTQLYIQGHFSLLYFVPFLNYESVHLISSKWTVEIPSQSGFQCPLLPLGSTSPENQFEMRLPLFLWMKSSGLIHSSKMAMKKVIILIFLFC